MERSSDSPGHHDTGATVGRAELLVDGSDAAFRRLVHNLLAFGARLRDIRDGLAALCGLTGSAYSVLIAVARLEQEGPVNVTLLAQHLNVSQPFVTTEVAKLVDAGLIDKRRSPDDGRVMVLSMTTSGAQRLARLAPDQQQVNDRLFQSLDASTFTQLRHLVPTLINDADAALDMARQALHDKTENVA